MVTPDTEVTALRERVAELECVVGEAVRYADENMFEPCPVCGLSQANPRHGECCWVARARAALAAKTGETPCP